MIPKTDKGAYALAPCKANHFWLAVWAATKRRPYNSRLLPPLNISVTVENSEQPGKDRHRGDEQHQRGEVQPLTRRRRVRRVLDRGSTHRALGERRVRRSQHKPNRNREDQQCTQGSHPKTNPSA